MKRSEVDRTKLAPMMRQYMEIKDEYPDTLIFFRLGDFYEMFFEDAIAASRELELALTGRNAGLEEKVPMCGVPYHSVSLYLDKLLERGYRVAICEQVTDPKDQKGIVKREVIQVVSKGVNMNSESLDEKDNNYIGAVIDFEHAYALAFMDITTGEFKTVLLNHNINNFISDILSFNIKELVVFNDFDKEIVSILRNNYNMLISFSNEIDDNSIYNVLYQDITDERYTKVAKYLLTYLTSSSKRSLSHIQKLEIIIKDKYLKMDINTKRNLELVETIRQKERLHSLLWLLDKTKTAMGSRLLKSWIENPLTDIDELNKRYDIIEKLTSEFILKEELKELLNEVYDLERLSGRIAFGNANGRDVIQLKNSLKVLPEVNKILKTLNYENILEDFTDLYNLLEKSIYENPPVGVKEGYLIKEGYSSELDELKNARKGGKDFISKLEQEERERTGIKNLKVGYNKIFGYYIEISKGNVGLVKEEFGYIRKQTLANCERYVTPLLKEKEELILGAEEKIINLEYNLFNDIKDTIKKEIPKLQQASKIIATIDVLVSLCVVAESNNYIRPTLTLERKILIKEGRHPVVEKVMDKEYVPNDCLMDENTNVLLITGPNMAGKSTYMRQLAVIAIMAQIGSFVPANECTLPIFDKIFTRIGASDDLVGGESTFMVEMKEANNAISNATNKSLILFDELGRGTATYDGMSLAQSILEYVHNKVGAKTLFSTHYHELTTLDKELTHLKNVHVSALEEKDSITFLHKIKEGYVDKSYGIHVARLANLPGPVITRADSILKQYEDKDSKTMQVAFDLTPTKEEKKDTKILDMLEKIDPLQITPIEALTILNKLKEESKEAVR